MINLKEYRPEDYLLSEESIANFLADFKEEAPDLLDQANEIVRKAREQNSERARKGEK